MIIDIIQTSKEMFTAEFEVKRGDLQIGIFSLQGKLCSPYAKIQGSIFNQPFVMLHGKPNDLDVIHPYRPYLIQTNNAFAGVVYQTEFNGGLFKKFDYQQLCLDEKVFDCFGIELGKEGGKQPIYRGNRQIAQIDTDCVIYNDLHNFKIYAENAFFAQIAVFFCIHGYAVAGFKPGEKVTWSKVKDISVTTNKLLKSKYNPDFKDGIEE